MDIEQSYFSVSRFFDAWVRVMELRTRRMEVLDSKHWGAKILIISPPTDTGIKLLAKANKHGQTMLLCFSERLKRIATTYCRKHGIAPLNIHTGPLFRLPFKDGEFATIYANCLFDFCQDRDFVPILEEMWRVLSIKGSLFAVYMTFPNSFQAHGWTWACRKFSFLSQGCRPVSIAPHLSRCGFLVQKDMTVKRLGFPIRYTYADKQASL